MIEPYEDSRRSEFCIEQPGFGHIPSLWKVGFVRLSEWHFCCNHGFLKVVIFDYENADCKLSSLCP